jgi:hypothetical protein
MSRAEIRTRLATGAVALGEVTALDHELLDDTVEGGALVAEALLAGGQSAEVLGRLGDGLAVQAHDNAPDGLIAVLDVEVDLVGDLGALGSHGGLGEHQASADHQRRGDNELLDVEHFDYCDISPAIGSEKER